MDIDRINIFGAYLSIIILSTSGLIFVFRLLNRSAAEYWTGIIFMLTAVPLLYLLFTAPRSARPALYYIQLTIMIAFIILELLLDYILKIDFRNIKWAAISYVTLFFAGTGGMIGIASQAGRLWAIISIVMFLIMASLAFVQHLKTGL